MQNVKILFPTFIYMCVCVCVTELLDFLVQLNRQNLKNKGGNKEIPFYSKSASSETMIWFFFFNFV